MESINVVFSIVGNIAGAAVGALIGALFVQLATKIVVKFKPPYAMAYLASFCGYLASALLSLTLQFLISLRGNGDPALSIPFIIATSLISFVAQIAVYSYMIKDSEGNYLSFAQALLVGLIQFLLGLLILGIIVAILAATIGIAFFTSAGGAMGG